MTRMIDTPPRDTDRRSAVLVVVIAGILGSVVGIGVILLAFVLSLAAGSDPRSEQAAGYLLIATAGFLVSAAGTDLRRIALRR